MKPQIKKVALGVAFLLALSLCGASAARANNYAFSAGSFSRSNIGNIQGAAGYDGLTLTGTYDSFDLIPGSSTTLPLSDVYFNVGYTGANSAGPNNETASLAVTLDGVTEILNLPFTIDIGMYQDTLTIGTGKLNFNLGNAGAVSLSSIQFGPLKLRRPYLGVLDGTFSASPVSEPASLVLLGTGLMLIGGVLSIVRRSLLEDVAVAPSTAAGNR